jgi:hypothetical protein
MLLIISCLMFSSQGADGAWRRGLHGRAILQEGQAD